MPGSFFYLAAARNHIHGSKKLPMALADLYLILIPSLVPTIEFTSVRHN